ncbi:hypothetical protein EC912_11123 [Luteibacter rhizovicinus]|uniref:Acetate kinase n=1 Tax=Luteibacter rhizovicinus TaxID=242606 RepID=A0A4R3YGY9_9GAMM|nr:acetate kinase [Luteibacter rhizovicinus]TCV91430.1 hypothetical protein EC912_11123 [Luteibacter rhizovicinus]
MHRTGRYPHATIALGTFALACLPMCIGAAWATDAPVDPALRDRVAAQSQKLDAMRSRVAEQSAELEEMKRALARQEAEFSDLRKAVGLDSLDASRGGSLAASGQQGGAAPSAPQDATTTVAQSTRPVGKPPEQADRPPEVAPIFDQPGVLTPKGKVIIEPSYQFGYSSSDRVALVGYTVIPAILIGLIDVRQVKTTTQTGAMAFRYGLTNRLELEVRVPYVDSHTDTISREIFTGAAQDNLFSSSGKGLGDIEATARYQINKGGPDSPYYVGWFRVKSRTGKDPFEVTTDCVTRCVQNATGTGLPLELPTGTGFYSAQAGVTWLYPSDPVVFFGNLSYLHNFTRNNVSRTVLLAGKQFLGNVKAGDIADVSVGMGLALNEKASISIGYDQSFVGRTTQNGQALSASARTVLGSLLIGGSYRFSDKRTLNVTLGVGVTRDTPDTTVTVRLPMSY